MPISYHTTRHYTRALSNRNTEWATYAILKVLVTTFKKYSDISYNKAFYLIWHIQYHFNMTQVTFQVLNNCSWASGHFSGQHSPRRPGPLTTSQTHCDGWFYMSTWLGNECPDIWSNAIWGVLVFWVFLDEINIWICVNGPQQSAEGPSRTKDFQERIFASLLGWAGYQSSALDWIYPIGCSRSPACWLERPWDFSVSIIICIFKKYNI